LVSYSEFYHGVKGRVIAFSCDYASQLVITIFSRDIEDELGGIFRFAEGRGWLRRPQIETKSTETLRFIGIFRFAEVLRAQEYSLERRN
jgi:hypothetical protein